MTLGSCLRFILRYNPLLINSDHNKLAIAPLRGPIKSNNSFLTLLIFSRILTPGLAPTLGLSLISVLNTWIIRYTDKNLQQAIKLALKVFF